MTAPPARAPATAAVLIGTVDPATADEALRAAVGLTLRGARVLVVLADPTVTFGARGARAQATLRLFAHRVEGSDHLATALQATTVEVWGPVAAPAAPAALDGASPHPAAVEPPVDLVHPVAPRLHLVRPGRAYPLRGGDDLVVDLPDRLDDATADRLLELVVPAGAVVW